MEHNWDAVRTQLQTVPSSASLRALLKDIGCPYSPTQINIDDTLLKDTFLYCKEVRPRYTVFQTVYDLGLMDKLSDRVIARIKTEE